MPRTTLIGPPIKKPFAWSFSRWKSWKECAFKYKCQTIDKLPEGPRGEALINGELVHKDAEDFVKGLVKPLPTSLRLFDKQFADLKKRGALAEDQFAFTKEWKATGWFAKDCWCRIKIDVHYPEDGGVLTIIDHKTGKVREGEYDEQLELYALGGFLSYEGVEVVHTKLWFLDHQVIIDETYTVAQVPKLKAAWEKRVKPMEADTRYQPTPGRHCQWCAYSASKGGPCKF